MKKMISLTEHIINVSISNKAARQEIYYPQLATIDELAKQHGFTQDMKSSNSTEYLWSSDSFYAVKLPGLKKLLSKGAIEDTKQKFAAVFTDKGYEECSMSEWPKRKLVIHVSTSMHQILMRVWHNSACCMIELTPGHAAFSPNERKSQEIMDCLEKIFSLLEEI